jgi:hypothetical protein
VTTSARGLASSAFGTGVPLAALWLCSAAPASAVCSVFDGKPCAPTVCSVFDEGPCMPEVQYPVGQDLRVTIRTRHVANDTNGETARNERLLGAAKVAEARVKQCPADAKPAAPLNTLQDMFDAFCACWAPPAEEARPGMEITVRMSLNRKGEILGEPRFTFVLRETTDKIKASYRTAVVAMLSRCTPLPLTEALGGAVAGRPFTLRFIDSRGLKGA